jgi:hypothetical protein
MDPIKNPFSPGAGSPPPELVGRDPILDQARIFLGRVKKKRAEKSMMLTGLRGVGRTVLLNEIERLAWLGNRSRTLSGCSAFRISELSRQMIPRRHCRIPRRPLVFPSSPPRSTRSIDRRRDTRTSFRNGDIKPGTLPLPVRSQSRSFSTRRHPSFHVSIETSFASASIG